MSANLIGWGCDLQQKLDAMDRKLVRARWAGYVADDLYRIAQRLHALNLQPRSGRMKPAHERAERHLLGEARTAVQELGFGIEVYRQPQPLSSFVVLFPGNVPKGSGPEAVFEQGVWVPSES